MLAGKKSPEKDRARHMQNHMNISIKISIENYFQSLNENGKLA